MDVQFLEFFSENQLGQQEAWIWFLIVPILMILGFITYNYLKGDTMAILGMQQAGKTTILRYMKDLPFDSSYRPTDKEPYEKFEWKVGDRKIKSGIDIGGGDEWVKENYPNLIKENEIIMFVFNAKLFWDSEKYRRITLARLDFVFEQIKESKDSIDDFIKDHFALIGTHADLITESPKSVVQKIQRDYQDKSYSKIFKNNFAILDLTSSEDFDKFIEKVFKKDGFLKKSIKFFRL